MKQQLQKKLYAFIVTAMMFYASATAQIIYTDVNPDTTLSCFGGSCTKSYNLDLNNDGTVDFTLYTSALGDTCPGHTRRRVYVNSQSGNATVTLMMNANDLIDNNLAFNASIGTLRSNTKPPGLVWTSCSVGWGSWTSTSDHYLGLQLTVGPSTYYGWVRLNVAIYLQGPGVVSFIVKDYAYNSIPNQPILAGQTVATGIAPLSFGEVGVSLFPNPANNHLTIALPSNNKKVDVTITDITGKIIYKSSAFEAQKIEVNTEDFATGIYVVQIQTADFIVTKKLVVGK
ncbi:MAG: T9SS type A sorting domain-containing protein [Bacteroidia bacterium]